MYQQVNSTYKTLTCIIALFLATAICFSSCSCGNQQTNPQLDATNTSHKDNSEKTEQATVIPEPVEPDSLYGFPLDDYHVIAKEIRSGESLGKILNKNGIDHRTIHNIAKQSEDVFDVTGFKVGQPYTLFTAKDSTRKAKILVYEEDKINYVVYDMRDSITDVYRTQHDVEIILKEGAGVINSSLSQSAEKNGLTQRLANVISDEIYPWTIDFFRIQKGDRYKLIYEAKYVNGEFVGTGKVHAVLFEHHGHEFYAFAFEENKGFEDYYDDEGNNLRKFFLKAPVQYSRISSRYSKRRKHPVHGRVKAHKGTDYAAPRNTPIYSTADGVVTDAKYSRYNGNYVKVRHNGTYTTQYLHMNKIKKGIKPGVIVKQGEVIGYVGKTGLATGYHVCYRFWKNGKQVDPFKTKLPPSEPIRKENLARYNTVKDKWLQKLIDIPYPDENTIDAETPVVATK